MTTKDAEMFIKLIRSPVVGGYVLVSKDIYSWLISNMEVKHGED